jgi:hypothetical protein
VNHSRIVSFILGVADLIRDTFKRGKYQQELRTAHIAAAVTGKIDVREEAP